MAENQCMKVTNKRVGIRLQVRSCLTTKHRRLPVSPLQMPFGTVPFLWPKVIFREAVNPAALCFEKPSTFAGFSPKSLPECMLSRIMIARFYKIDEYYAFMIGFSFIAINNVKHLLVPVNVLNKGSKS